MQMLCNKQKTLTAVLFVGGLSRRMGADKATLPFAGGALWARQLQLLRESKADVVSISARVRPEWCPSEVEVIADEPPSRGPLSGLSAALRKAQTTHLLALAIDLPRMSPATLRRLWLQAAPGCGVIPSCRNMLEPLCAIYPTQVAADAADAIAHREDVSMQSFVRSLCRQNRMRVHTVDESDWQFFQNVNTPLELETCLSSLP